MGFPAPARAGILGPSTLMYAGRNYTLIGLLFWTRRELVVFALVAAIPTALDLLGAAIPAVPWAPLAILGTAVAFLTGFKGNASYGRLWEARQIWGGIVNSSRTWALAVRDLLGAGAVEGPARAARPVLMRRHFAWLTALRYQLREPREWENVRQADNVEYRARMYAVAEWSEPLAAALAAYLEPDELARVLAKKNRAAQLLALQSAHLRALADAGALTELRHLELTQTLAQLVEHQGKAERIKNFPYPRQFATLNRFFAWVFIFLQPFALFPEFHKLGASTAWLGVPLGMVVAWVFHTMDKIGTASENPFEGGPNDVPITAICRAIEIDLLEMFDAPEVPPPLRPVNHILM